MLSFEIVFGPSLSSRTSEKTQVQPFRSSLLRSSRIPIIGVTMLDAMPPPDKEKAQAAKQKGNDAFGRKQWAEAVGFYSAAHFADPTEPTYPLNRAMAYIKLEKYADAERDCTTALSLSPNNVKALYRRATAKVGADKLQEALQDYEAVLRLDPGNVEAKAGLAKALEAVESAKSRRTETIDMRKATTGASGASQKASSANVPTAESYSAAPSTSRTAQDSGSSVEAARKFLQQVGMSEPTEEQETAVTSKPSTSALPAKFPGEAGGYLREVTTRRTASKSTACPAPSLEVSVPASSPHYVPQATSSPPVPGGGSSEARKTASALNFGTSASQSTVKASVPQPKPRPASNMGYMSATEFSRRWKNESGRLKLLSSLDREAIPGMMDAMLEPDLVAEILQTLAKGHGSSSASGDLPNLSASILSTLPRCKRFGMTVSMLDATEKGQAAYLIDAVGRPDLRSVWEIQ